ncbi:hypothetical protein TNCV_4848701 [Trichonephila clavipes]|nr:hypothetical protein TNCV_4848701 [Trichonephila clavipes]
MTHVKDGQKRETIEKVRYIVLDDRQEKVSEIAEAVVIRKKCEKQLSQRIRSAKALNDIGHRYNTKVPNPAGIFCEYFSHYLSLGTDKTVFDVGVEAVRVTLTYIEARHSLSEQLNIFSSSQASKLDIPNGCHASISLSIMQQ